MKNLLDLPSEILSQIICEFFSSPCHTPLDGWRYRSLYEYTAVRNVVCRPSATAWPPDALSLLLTCQKTYSETNHYLANTRSVAKLDLAIIDFHWIWPTWRNLPPRSRAIDELHVMVVPCCTRDERHLQTADSFNDSLSPTTSDKNNLKQLLSGFVCDWIGRIFPRLPREASSVLDSLVLPHFSSLTITFDAMRYPLGPAEISTGEVPLRKIDGLAHLDFKHLYPIDIWASLEQLTLMDDMIPFGSTPSALLPDQVVNGVRVHFVNGKWITKFTP